jgi:hypothetical protein
MQLSELSAALQQLRKQCEEHNARILKEITACARVVEAMMSVNQPTLFTLSQVSYSCGKSTQRSPVLSDF